jgi:hypothetical protein
MIGRMGEGGQKTSLPLENDRWLVKKSVSSLGKGKSLRPMKTPPPGLSPASIRIWSAELRGRTKSLARVRLLEQFLRTLDEVDRLRELLSAGPLIVTTPATGVQHVHPAVAAGATALATATRLARLLGLQWDSSRDGAPAEPVNRYMQPLWRQAQSWDGQGDEAHDEDDAVSRGS